MSSVREQILTAVLVALNADRPEGVPEFSRERGDPVEAGDLPAGDVRFPPTDQPQETESPVGGKTGPLVIRHLLISVAVSATGATSACLDELLIHANSRLAGNRLGGLAHTVHGHSTAWRRLSLDADYWQALRTFAVTYQTKKSDETLTS